MIDCEADAKVNGFDFVIGIDEAGRGPLAGPVTAAAILLKDTSFKNKIHDSKQLTPSQRLSAFEEIYEKAYVGVGIMSESVIDYSNILQATFFAMNNAVEDLVSRLPESLEESFNGRVLLLVDGNRFKTHLPYQHRSVVGGDAQVFSIACASIVAKVIRDRILDTYDKIYPQYGFARHKGYPTMQHKQAIRRFGLSLIHRKSFRYV